jgi:ADP-heptose:LPS heptosyltransferase
MVMTLPLIKALKENLPGAEIYILGSLGNAEFLRGDEHIREVFIVDKAEDIKKMFKIYYDLAIDTVLDWRLRSALLARKSNAEFLIGFDLAHRGKLFDLSIKPQGQKSMSEFILDLVRPLGFKISSSIPQLVPTPQDKTAAEQYLAGLGLDLNRKIVVIHPGGHYPSQRWMPERFAAVADEVIRHTAARVIMIVSKNETPIVEAVKAQMKEQPFIIIDCPFRILAVLVSRAHLFIGNNSGPLHLAAAVGTPTVSLMGPTVPYLWRPQGENQIVLRKDMACSPCQKAHCYSHRCLKEIEISEVIEKIGELWKDLYGDWK